MDLMVNSSKLQFEPIKANKRHSVELQMQSIVSAGIFCTDFYPKSQASAYTKKSFHEEVSLIPKVREQLPRYIAHLPTDESVLLCLRGRKYNVQRAANSVITYELWKRTNFVNHISRREVMWTLRQYRLSAPGCVDKEGRRIVYFLGPENPDTPLDVELLERAVVFLICQLLKMVEVQVNGIIIVHNVAALAPMGNSVARRTYLRRLHQLTKELPIRVGGLLLYNMPMWWQRVLVLLWPLLREKMKSRVVLVSRGKQDLLRSVISEGQLLPELGGSYKFDMDVWTVRTCALRGEQVAL